MAGGLAKGGVDGARIGQVLGGNLTCLSEDGGIFAVVAEEAEECARNSRVLAESVSAGGASLAYSGAKVERIQAASAARSSALAAMRE
jgi:hypothetical protein